MNWNRHAYKYIFHHLAAFSLVLNGIFIPAAAQVELRYKNNETVTWQEAIDMYEWLDEQYEDARLLQVGLSDAGKALHLFVIDRSRTFSPEKIRESGRNILFINNGIHAGEPCGVDASLKLAGDLLSGADSCAHYLDHTAVAIVPLFNVGGALNRGSYHRANQNGPVEHGFRGNARNLDLNRDFIKLDSRNTQSLVALLRSWDPDIFVDTHTSNGSDYPYTITLINSHSQRHEPSQAGFLNSTLLPFLYEGMARSPYLMSPYVWSFNRTPDEGIIAFMDYPRFTSGYVSLFNTFAFTVETHMFKSFEDRVLSTWHLLRETLRFSGIYGKDLARVKREAWKEKLNRREFTLQWQLDSSRADPVHFSGYAVKQRKSKVTGQNNYYFDRNDPWEKVIPYYKYFSPLITVPVPDYYILPSAWREVVKRLQLNGVKMEQLERDSLMELEIYYIDKYKTLDHAYNGHYRHYDVETRTLTGEVQLFSGDWIIPARQEAVEYLVQTLEPRAYDSFFSWNFFDEILSRNEYFSPYIFEETAGELLKSDPLLKKEFKRRQDEDPEFAKNAHSQLRFIYEHSPWSESTYLRYPVYRMSH
ncbi:MAG: M14 family zinc carboxypeptidase [Bacteroidales bacterium]|nr:M14 family zinc carboxypeptidase [Bacteroidales bacterium]